MTADEMIKVLKMKEHPKEGGYFSVVWRSAQPVPKGILLGNHEGDRIAASSIYYLLKASQISKWHKLISDEYWYWHYGGTLEMTLGGTGEKPVEKSKLRIGCNCTEGENFQIYAPGGHWQTTKVVDGDFVLVSCVVVPGFESEDCFFE